MRTEAKPCSLGRSVSAYSNERRCDHLVRNPWLHVLITLPPRMVLFSFPHHHGPGRGRNGPSGFSYWLLQFGKGWPLPAVVHLHCSVFPFADQGLAFRGPIARLPGLQLQAAALMPGHPIVAN